MPGGTYTVARTSSVVLSVAVVTALCAAAIVVLLRFSENGLRGLLDALGRLLRHESDHPHWELLAQ